MMLTVRCLLPVAYKQHSPLSVSYCHVPEDIGMLKYVMEHLLQL